MLERPATSIINVLFVSSTATAIHEIKDYLWQSGKLAYRIEHRLDFFGSADLLIDGESDVDVILLDLSLFGSPQSRDVFRRMVTMAHGIPIIVFTTGQNHDTALMAIAEGAVDHITHGNLETQLFKFQDAIDFAHVRTQNLKLLHGPDEPARHHTGLVHQMTARTEDTLIAAVEEIETALTHAKLSAAILLAEAAVKSDAESDQKNPLTPQECE